MPTTDARRLLSLDATWRFHRGDVPAPLPNTHIAAYMANKAGWARGAAAVTFDDSDWREVRLPHDWSVEGPFDPDNHLDNGFLPRGVGWYRRHFRLDEEDRGKHLALRFDGVSTHCTVYVNGHLLCRNFCGYTPFTIDITDLATFGEQLNVVAVFVDATYVEGWWYEGAGIYRHVWLLKTGRVHVAEYGTFVRPERKSDASWDTHVETTIENGSDSGAACELSSQILSPGGEPVASERIRVDVPARSSVTARQTLPVRDPQLWSLEDPRLYQLHTELRCDGTLADDSLTPFGYRTIRFDPEQGFFLNDKPVKLKGTCNHQDHAGVGVALPDSLHAFRVRRLLDMGSNAYRCAHNPPAPELLDACDRLGMLVMDETRNFGPSPEHLAQLRAMVFRDRNHPCVILWSICNEEAIQATRVGEDVARTMAAAVRQLDPSRPVTAAVSGGVLGDVGIGEAIDVMGINYQLATHDPFHAKHPEKPLYAAETHCALTTRGTYETDPDRHVFGSYDTEKAAWGATARETWRSIARRPFVAGLFIWTGFDYRGEPTPHAWPSVNSHWGILDTCGFAKDAFFLHKAFFTAEPFVHLLPHWNWAGREGEPVRVALYTNGEEGELFLNGESLGRKAVDPIDMAEWLVPYRPGVLKGIAFRDGRLVAETAVQTTGPAEALGLEVHPSAEAASIPADGEFTLPVTAFAADSEGRRVPTTEDRVEFSVDGAARILGVGNGDPTCHEPDVASSRSLFRGLAQVLVQTATTPGAITLAAKAPGLKPAILRLTSHPSPPRAVVPPASPRHFITDWRMSPITAERPDVNQAASAQDMNTWERIDPSHGPQPAWAVSGGYALYRATATPPRSIRSRGGRIVFHEVIGAAEVFVNGSRRASKLGAAAGGLAIEVAPSAEPLSLSILVRAAAAPAGLTRAVEMVSGGGTA